MKFLVFFLGVLGASVANPPHVLLDARTGATLESTWDGGPEERTAFGSLVKPFTALAYAQSHGYRYPPHVCKGCWLPRGHGRIGIREAIAHSCNSYFQALAAEVRAEEVAVVLERYGIAGLPRNVPPETLIGEGQAWQATPVEMARAYVELTRRGAEPGVRELLDGMVLSARLGTGRGAGLPALVKTGTGPCGHTPHEPGDGYAILLYPAEQPRFALLLQVHGAPGAQAATQGGKMLRARAGLP
jgi:hypothetical protein